ncbi:hypothetical protein ML401_06835 [Bradyrhizobium sp. 62B]|nr:hypothetical protein ML401_06835 [Bradyrhizobium sp. 62B]
MREKTRFDQRIQTALRWIFAATAIAASIHGVFSGEILVFALSEASIVVAYAGARAARNGRDAIIATHPAILFVTTTYLYSSLHGNIVPEGLNEPKTALLITLVYQGSVIIGLFFADLLEGVFTSSTSAKIETQFSKSGLDALSAARFPLIALGVVGLLIAHQFEGSGPLTSIFSLLMWLGMATHFAQRRGVLPLDWVTVFIIGLTAVIAISANARSALFETLLFLGFAHLMFARRLFTLAQVVAGLLLIRAISVFSDIMLSVRWLRQISTARMVEQALDYLFSIETLSALVNPFYVSEAQAVWAKAIDPNSQFTSHFFVGNISTLQRFTLLPQMDLILHGLRTDSIRWSAILNIPLSQLPDIGQQKDLIFSDRITWELGLRAYGNIGRPMVTAAGEFYAMGGLAPLIVLTVVLFTSYFIVLRILKAAIGSDQIVTLVFSQLIVATLISTTAIGAYGVVFRTIPALVVFVGMIKYFVAQDSRKRLSAPPAIRPQHGKNIE